MVRLHTENPQHKWLCGARGLPPKEAAAKEYRQKGRLPGHAFKNVSGCEGAGPWHKISANIAARHTSTKHAQNTHTHTGWLLTHCCWPQSKPSLLPVQAMAARLLTDMHPAPPHDHHQTPRPAVYPTERLLLQVHCAQAAATRNVSDGKPSNLKRPCSPQRDRREGPAASRANQLQQ